MEERKPEHMPSKDNKRWLGKGIYGSKDVPIRILDGLIGLVVVLIIVMVLVFAVNGGYYVTFETHGGTEIEKQKIDYGKTVKEPEEPLKAGYKFEKWVTSEDISLAEEWNYREDTVKGDMTLYAVWTPAEITVKFDLDGGTYQGLEQIEDINVTFGGKYSGLLIPEKEGYVFDGWEYSGNIITEETVVSTSGEHVLTARWRKE